MTQLEDKAPLAQLEEITMGGMVTGIRVGETKKGSLYGIVKMEDFSGTGELALFGKDWLDFHNCFIEGAPLFIRAKVTPNQWRQGDYNLQLKAIDLLADVKDSLIERITLSVPLDKLSTALVQDLAEIARECPGKAELFFNVHSADNMKARLFARKIKISVQRPLIHFFNEHPEIEFSINS
jgi:DNA polymerase-3 subunit alpha